MEHITCENTLHAISSSNIMIQREKFCALFSLFEIPDFVIDCVNHINESITSVYISPVDVSEEKLEIIRKSVAQVFIITDDYDDNEVTQIINGIEEVRAGKLKGSFLLIELNFGNRRRNWNRFRFQSRKICIQSYKINEKYLIVTEQGNRFNCSNENGLLYLSSIIARSIRSVLSQCEFKAIIVNDKILLESVNDNGSAKIGETHLMLQSFLAKHARNFSLILWSRDKTQKNIEKIFDKNGDKMILKTSHFSKVIDKDTVISFKDALKSLDLNADEIIFFGENFDECTHMINENESTLSLCLPPTALLTRGLLNNIWSLEEFEVLNGRVLLNNENTNGENKTVDVFQTIDFYDEIDSCKKWLQSLPEKLKMQKKIKLLNPLLLDERFEQHFSKYKMKVQLNTLELTWKEVLGSHPCDESHFFNCGGNSMKALCFVSKIRETLRIDFTLKHIFLFPTFRKLREIIETLPSFEQNVVNSIESDDSQLSLMQRQFVLLQKLAPNSTAYTECTAVFGTFHELNLKSLFYEMLKTFPFLTSTICEHNGNRTLFRIPIEEIIESCIETIFGVNNLEEAIEQARKLRPCFEIQDKQPLVKLLEVKIKNDISANTLIVLFTHHLLVDEASAILLEKALLTILAREKFTLPFSLKSFAQYTGEEKNYLASIQRKTDFDYFEKIFCSQLPEISLSFGAESWSDTKVYAVKRESSLIDLNIHNVCESLNISHFHFYLSCYLLTLRRYSAEDDLLINIPVTRRSHEYENAFGLFLNMMLFRFKFDYNCDVQKFFREVAFNWIATQERSSLHLTELLSYLSEKKRISGIKMNNWFNYSLFSNCKNVAKIPPKHAKAPFLLNVYEYLGAKTEIHVDFATDLIDECVANNFLTSFVYTCKEMEKHFDSLKNKSVSSIDVLTDDQRKQILSLNREMLPISKPFVHRHFEAHCENNADKIAIICEERAITYKNLNEMANKIAAFLQKLIPEDDIGKKPIVLMMDRNEFVFASILAVWKIGGFFLPISSDMQQLLLRIDNDQSLDVDFVLTNFSEKEIVLKLPNNISLIDVRDVISSSNAFNFEERLAAKEPENTYCYLYLTSGTTGVPKKCFMTHQNLNVTILGYSHDLEIRGLEIRSLQWSPISFDALIFEMCFSLLGTAGTVTIVSDRLRFDAAHVESLFNKHKISFIISTPQYASSILLKLSKESLKSLQIIFVTADAFYQQTHKKLTEKLDPQCKIFNGYGSTETSVCSTAFAGEIKYLTSTALVPIGKPVPGHYIYIVDPTTKLLSPVGTVGEICIGGSVLSKGDIKTTTLKIAGENQIYLTGDYGRLLPDGNMDYIGRKGSSFVKVKSFRVSPREIELTIIKHLGAKIDFVLAFDAKDRFDETIICLTYKQKFATDTNLDNEIRNLLKSRLPYYMIPSIIKAVTNVPITENGKTDRNALKQLCLQVANSIQNVTENETLTETERMLINHISSSISLSMPIDVNTNFRDQGIHSLALMKIANILLNEKVTGFKSVADLFDYPTVKLLAQKIDSLDSSRRESKEKVQQKKSNKIAVVGIAFRLPKNIRTLSDLWCIFGEAKSQVDHFPQERENDFISRLDEYNANLMKNIEKFKGSFLSSVDSFDNEFFGIPSSEALHMCPEQRLWIEVATEALVDCELLGEVRGKRIGVFITATDTEYGKIDVSQDPLAAIGKKSSMLARRITYKFDLRGKALTIETECSSGLAVLHEAIEAINSGSCESALVGGASIFLYPAKEGTYSDRMGTGSPDYCCRPFDEDANGTVAGEGVIALVLEPLEIAAKNKRFIYGVIEGSAMNNVGQSNGITAPSAASQVDVIERALDAASISQQQIQFIESHGTGTQLGDAIEIEALKQVFAENPSPVLIGTSKANFGHLDHNAGLLGVLKALSILMFNEIPRACNFERPNPALLDSNLMVPTQKLKLHSKEISLGISAFGLSGTNVHCILSNYTGKQQKHEDGNVSYPLLLSAFEYYGLQQIIKQFVNYMQIMVKQYQVTTIAEICAGMCRHLKAAKNEKNREEKFRIAVMLYNVDQAIELLSHLQDLDYKQLMLVTEREKNFFMEPTSKNEAVNSFITNGKIENELIESFMNISSAPSLPISIFKNIRHWPDLPIKTFSTKINNKATNLKELLETNIKDLREVLHVNDFRPDENVQPTIDKLGAVIITRFFKEISMAEHWHVGRTFKTRELFNKTNIHERYYILFQTLLKHLAKFNIIKCNSTILDELPIEFTILRDLNDAALNENPQEIANYGMKHFRDYTDCFEHLLHCMPYVKDILTSDLSPLTVLYPEGDLTSAKRLERSGDPLGNIYMKKFIQVMGEYVKYLARDSEETIRVLEVGGGMGIVTRQLALKLAPISNVEYWFTDIGKGFVNNAKKYFSTIKNMKFHVFDVTKTAEEQGFEHKFDVIVGLNVIHATENIRQTTSKLSSSLTETGILFILENTRPNIWITLTDGLFDGWWYFKDYDLRSDALCNASIWEKVLSGLNFGTVYSLPTNKEEREYVEKFMFVCCKQKLGELQETEDWWQSENLQIDNDLKPKKLNIDRNYTSVLKFLREIWQRLLGIDRNIREQEIFRELGGESLLALQMTNEVKENFGVKIQVAHIYANPSLKELALHIKNLLDQQHDEQEAGGEKEVTELSEDMANEQKDLMREELYAAPKENINEREPSTMLMFCGQGSQKLDMLQSLVDDPSAKAILDKAKKMTGIDFVEESKNSRSLQRTSFIQMALFVGSIAKAKQMEARDPEIVKNLIAIAGLSVGEFAALTFAGVLEFADALKIVHLRGLAMQRVVDELSTAMCSILGPTTAQLQNFLGKNYPNLIISGYLADNQHTVSGENEIVDAFLNEIREENVTKNLNLIDARKLRVAGAFHTDFMRKAASEIESLIDSTEFKEPNIPIILNFNGSVVKTANVIKSLVKKQLISPLQWRQTMLTAVEMGVRNFIEISPSPILTAIVRKRIQECAEAKCTAEFFKF